MSYEFESRIKKIENELLALKTTSLYTSIRNTVTTSISSAYTGLYRINYQTNGGAILSQIYVVGASSWGVAYPRTPQGSSQIVEIDTTEAVIGSGSVYPIIHNSPFIIISNVPVTSITRIS